MTMIQRVDAEHDAEEGESSMTEMKPSCDVSADSARDSSHSNGAKVGFGLVANGFIHSRLHTDRANVGGTVGSRKPVDSCHEVSRATTSAGLSFSRVRRLRA